MVHSGAQQTRMRVPAFLHATATIAFAVLGLTASAAIIVGRSAVAR